MKKCYFDHKTKPSTFVVKNNGEEIFRGNFTEGYKIFQDLPKNNTQSINMNWDEYAMGIAEAVAKKSKDPWCKVGAVILREDNSIASVGYNGFPQGQEEDWSDREERRKFVIHAEQNALRYTKPGEGKTLVSTLLPCRDCLKTIAAYKIKRVLYKEIYKSDPIALEIAEKMGVTLSKL
jgi:dCMP deaminase